MEGKKDIYLPPHKLLFVYQSLLNYWHKKSRAQDIEIARLKDALSKEGKE